MKFLIKPLTKKMLMQLQRGRAIELSGSERNMCNAADFKGTLSGLYRRGFVNTKMMMDHGKNILFVYITDAGISFLFRYEEDLKRLKDRKA